MHVVAERAALTRSSPVDIVLITDYQEPAYFLSARLLICFHLRSKNHSLLIRYVYPGIMHPWIAAYLYYILLRISRRHIWETLLSGLRRRDRLKFRFDSSLSRGGGEDRASVSGVLRSGIMSSL